jgi:dTDP-glucose 4,6-dehydratase
MDPEPAARDLGFRSTVALEEGLAATATWYRTHRDWWTPLLPA